MKKRGLLVLSLVAALTLSMTTTVHAVEDEKESIAVKSAAEEENASSKAAETTAFKSTEEPLWANPDIDNYVKEIEIGVERGTTKVSVIYPMNAKAPTVKFTTITDRVLTEKDADEYAVSGEETFSYGSGKYGFRNYYITTKENASYKATISLGSANADIICVTARESKVSNSLTPGATPILYYFTRSSSLKTTDISEMLNAGNKTFEEIDEEETSIAVYIVMGAFAALLLAIVAMAAHMKLKKKRILAAQEESRRYVKAMNAKFRKTKEQEKAYLEKILSSYDEEYVDEITVHAKDAKIIDPENKTIKEPVVESVKEPIQEPNAPTKPSLPKKPVHTEKAPLKPVIKTLSTGQIFG